MTSVWDFLFGPFAEFAFMRRALVACCALALGSAPIGVVLMLRRMSLFGEAMSHAILPGAAVGFLVAGFSLPAISIGGVIAGLVVALLAGAATRATDQGKINRMSSAATISPSTRPTDRQGVVPARRSGVSPIQPAPPTRKQHSDNSAKASQATNADSWRLRISLTVLSAGQMPTFISRCRRARSLGAPHFGHLALRRKISSTTCCSVALG